MLSILITHYNRPKALKKCLSSIADLKLTIPFEVIVSDDGSLVENQEIIKSYNIDKLLLSSKNEGLASNINKGIKACNKSNYLLYCQEDCLIVPEIKSVLNTFLTVLDSGKLDMIRLTANYKFSYLIKVTEGIYRIPRFSFRNFNINTFQYSDNPFITKVDFFHKYGFYLEGTSGPFGETEYAIRILNTNANIGITNKKYSIWQEGVQSVINPTNTVNTLRKRSKFRKIKRLARALRQHLEWVLYNPNNRKLYTYKNKRVNK
jgi:glycosyltransferase involved in cell wall biosynthesis